MSETIRRASCSSRHRGEVLGVIALATIVPSAPIESGRGNAYGQVGRPLPPISKGNLLLAPTGIPTETPIPTPTTMPTVSLAVRTDVATAIPGQALVAAGAVPDTALTYSLRLLSNSGWTTGGPIVAASTAASTGGSFRRVIPVAATPPSP